MTPEWVDPAISGGAALFGALIGGGAILLNTRVERASRRRAEHVEALSNYYAAANNLASFAHREPVKRNALDEISFRLEERMQTGNLLRRLFALTDGFWQASARLRAIADDAELEVIDRIEGLIGDVKFFEPAPEGWVPAMAEFRTLMRTAAGHGGNPLKYQAEPPAKAES